MQDMLIMAINVAGLQLLIPLLLLAWQWRARAGSAFVWTAKTMLVLGYLVLTALAGLWLLLPVFLPYVLILLSVLLAAREAKRVPHPQQNATNRHSSRLKSIAAALVAIGVWSMNAYVLDGWRMPDGEAVKLQFPLRDGSFYIANGGANTQLNPHIHTLSDVRFAPYRGQSYGVDIVQLNQFGFRANGILPEDLGSYVIYDTPVYAPCAGRVVHTENEREDLTPPEADKALPPGNHVLLKCGEYVILLAHLKKGSVQVIKGQEVKAGQVLGRIGNSGKTGEPHLHIHAQKSGSAPHSLDGEPVWAWFENGSFLVRNQVVRN